MDVVYEPGSFRDRVCEIRLSVDAEGSWGGH